MDLHYIFSKLSQHTPSVMGHKHYSQFAVLLPLVVINDEIHILFEVRSQDLRRQPGEICFPGGRIDPHDKNAQSAAIRETTEELGIAQHDIINVFPADYLVSPFGMIVYPYVGFIQTPENICHNRAEVEDVFYVPLSYFKENTPEVHRLNVNLEPEETFPFELIQGGKHYNWRTSKLDEYFYKYDDKVIWGLTARILKNFVDML
ncbi:CoA pyrophosphatase [Bacillus sp. HMF5848]|uniref:NUDIX hydrolase n=1 Tax=Bacillus sp. HMF5848 TaxID=2495421 RepID=UPI000F77A30C|nr:CoA pyrophosphatase [Bacillus sp. HMF5848]RSK29129.1 CoA pyrophosphatase [Bacillus sp. HMF5848]